VQELGLAERPQESIKMPLIRGDEDIDGSVMAALGLWAVV